MAEKTTKPQIEQLERLYLNLKTELILKKKFRYESVLVSMLYVKSNEGFKLLSEAALARQVFTRDAFDLLLANGFIRMAETPEKYAITCQGVWEIESRLSLRNLDVLFEHVDRKFFDVFQEDGQLSEKDKVILLAMIAVRSFSRETALDLKREDRILMQLKALLESAHALLTRHRVLKKLKQVDLFGATGNEHPVSQLIRHTDPLLKRTRGIYQTLGKQKYFLNISREAGLNEESLITLLGFIFGNEMSTELKLEIEEFCTTSAYELGAFLFDLSTDHFASPTFDFQFKEALEGYYAGRLR